MTENAEPNFDADVEEMQSRAETALNELTEMKAYTIGGDELRAFKAAQYGLRILAPEFDSVSNREKLEGLFDE